MAEILTYNSTNVISYIICILPVVQDYCLFYYQVYDWASSEMSFSPECAKNNDN